MLQMAHNGVACLVFCMLSHKIVFGLLVFACKHMVAAVCLQSWHAPVLSCALLPCRNMPLTFKLEDAVIQFVIICQ